VVTSALVPLHVQATAAIRPGAHPHLPPRLQAVCLDIDDTLVDFTTSARRALFGMIGRDDLWPAWQRLTEEHVARVVAGELDADTMRLVRTKAFLTDLGRCPDDAAIRELENRRRADMIGSWELFDDVMPCLDWLQAAGLRVAAVTNASGAHQRDKLAGLGIARFFDTVVIAGEVGAAKPDERIFQAACTRLDVPSCETLHVGDRLDVDALGARDAGLHGVWLDRRGAEPEADAGVHVIETLSDLPGLIISEYLTPCTSGPSGVPTPRPTDPVSVPGHGWTTISLRQHGQ
jgi:putative hydrolase of the HAD superfamily